MVSSPTLTQEGLDLPILHSVHRARSGRILAFTMAALLASLPLALVFVPWQQNVAGSGRVVALDPTRRELVIPAPISGRLSKLLVQEGERVVKDQVLAVMEDQDPDYFLQLEEQLRLAREKVEQARDTLESYQEKVNSLRLEKEAEKQKAFAELQVAVEEISEAEETARAKEAEIVGFLRPEARRQQELFLQGNTSDKKKQDAETKLAAKERELDAALAKIEQAVNKEKSKAAALDSIDAKFAGAIAESEAKVLESRQKLAESKQLLARKESDVRRQSTQEIKAPMDGTVLAIAIGNSQGFISRESPLMDFVPDTDTLVVEMILRGVDAPLVEPGRKARLIFEGWPAVQSPGWPSTAVGSFGGKVRLVDAQARPDGTVRALIEADPGESPWPDQPFLRQGVRTTGWIQLETVRAGYELWRQLNAFPPTEAFDGKAAEDATRSKRAKSGDKDKSGTP